MTTTDQLEQRFAAPGGMRKFFGLLERKRAARGEQLFATADARGVCHAYTLDHRIYIDNTYFIKAISLNGELSGSTITRLTQAAELVPLGRLRWEAGTAPTLPEALGSDPDALDIHSLSSPELGILVYAVSFLGTKRGSATYCVWARSGGDYFVLPVDDKRL